MILNTILLIFHVIIIGTVTKRSNGNEETGVTATKRGDIEILNTTLLIFYVIIIGTDWCTCY